jgi:ArsR family transcriptional regulator, arsenate/arsenite/antimonite-responsive transcriptional repressor
MDIEKIFKALGDPMRLKILKLLPKTPSLRYYKDGLNVNQLVEALAGTQPNISHHLKILKDAELIKQEKVRNNIFYYKNPYAIAFVREYLDGIED